MLHPTKLALALMFCIVFSIFQAAQRHITAKKEAYIYAILVASRKADFSNVLKVAFQEEDK